MKFSLAQVAEAVGTACAMDDVLCRGWSVDTRTLQPGDLFFALRGPNHDGHAHLDQAFRRGAVGAVVSQGSDAGGPLLVVDDTLTALQRLAAWARREWGGDVIGVTGSAGKTSTKDVIASLLSVSMNVGKTAGNFNNHVGLPLSLLRIPEDTRAAVLELGMNHAGEIRALCEIARPRVGVVTNVGYAHIECFNSIEGIALAKRELIDSLPADGVAVLNADDPLVSRFAETAPGRVVTFGLGEGADVRAEDVVFGSEGVCFHVDGVSFETRLIGRHAVSNILAGVAVARLFGIATAELVDAVRALEPGKMRGQRMIHNGVIVWDDCYNSNPDAAKAMLDVLRDTPAGRRIAVLGEMLELGTWSDALHRQVGRYAALNGIDFLVGVRGDARAMVEAAAQAGLSAVTFENPAAAGAYVAGMAQPGDAVLFKGSRGVRIELALERFLAQAEVA